MEAIFGTKTAWDTERRSRKSPTSFGPNKIAQSTNGGPSPISNPNRNSIRPDGAVPNTESPGVSEIAENHSTSALAMTYTITTTLNTSFEDALTDVTNALEAEGFGVLSDINVQSTFQEKLDVEMDQYRILGACNPPLAHEGISAETELGALLPCNVIVYESADGDVVVGAVDPEQLLEIAGNPALDEIAEEVKARLERAFEELAA